MLGTRSTRASVDGTGWTSLVGTGRDRTRAPSPTASPVGPPAPTLAMTSPAPPRGDTTVPPTPPSRHRAHETALTPGDSALTPGDSARYDARFASRAAGIVSSVMRDLMSLSERPDIISLAGGFPNTEAFEREIFDEVDGGRRARPPGLDPPVRPHRGDGRAARADRQRDGPRGRPRAGRGHHGDERRPAGHRPVDPHLREPGRHGPGRGPDLPRRGALLHDLRGPGDARPDGRRRPARSTWSRRRSTGWPPRGARPSCSTRSPASRTRAA